MGKAIKFDYYSLSDTHAFRFNHQNVNMTNQRPVCHFPLGPDARNHQYNISARREKNISLMKVTVQYLCWTSCCSRSWGY